MYYEGSEKEVYDERQQLLRNKITSNTYLTCVLLMLANAMFMELFYQWATYLGSLFVIYCICECVQTAILVKKDVLVGINGVLLKAPGKTLIVLACLNINTAMMLAVDDLVIIQDGVLTTGWMLAVGVWAVTAVEVAVLIVYKLRQKKEEKEE